MDKRLSIEFRGKKYIDGSFWTFIKEKARLNESHLTPYPISNNEIYIVDWKQDENFLKSNVGKKKITQTITNEELHEMMCFGYKFMESEIKKHNLIL
jgi:hypothetical protein